MDWLTDNADWLTEALHIDLEKDIADEFQSAEEVPIAGKILADSEKDIVEKFRIAVHSNCTVEKVEVLIGAMIPLVEIALGVKFSAENFAETRKEHPSLTEN